jgi:hypothetical protein
LHGMQEVVGSNPIGSILRDFDDRRPNPDCGYSQREAERKKTQPKLMGVGTGNDESAQLTAGAQKRGMPTSAKQ